MAKAEYRSAIRSRKLIIAALVDLLQEKPLDKITVTDVVRRAEINRGTFYAHYTDIPDVVNHMIQQTFSSLQEVLTDSPKTLADMCHALLKQIQTILEEDMFFCKKIMNSSVATLMQEQLVGILVDYMLQNKDLFYAGRQEEYDLIIRFGAGGLSNLYRDWFAGKLPYTLDELTQIGEVMIQRIVQDLK